MGLEQSKRFRTVASGAAMVIVIFLTVAGAALADGGAPPPPPPDTGGWSSPPTTTTATSSPAPKRDSTPPKPVGRLRAITERPGRTVLTWTFALAGDVAGVVVLRGPAGSCPVVGQGIRIGGLAPRRRQVDTTEHDRAAYCYAVFALDKIGNVSDPTTTGRVANLGDVTPPGPVTALSANLSSGGILLSWSSPAGAVAHVVVSRGPAGACPAKPADGTRIGGAGVRASQVDATAQPGVSYCYAVFAFDSAGNHSQAVSTAVGHPASQPPATPAPAAPSTPPAAPSNSTITRVTRVFGGGGVVIVAVVAFAAFRLVRRETQWHMRTGYTLRDVARVDLRAYDPLALVIPAVLGASVVGVVVVFLVSV